MSKKKRRARFSDEELDDILDQLGDELDTLVEEGNLLDVHQEIEELTHKIKNLPLQLAQVRRRGYVHAGELENQLNSLESQWQVLLPNIQDTIADYQDSLTDMQDDAEALWDRVDRKGKKRDVRELDDLLGAWEDQIDDAVDDLEGMYEGWSDQVKKVVEQLEEIDWMLTQLDESEIVLQPSEGPVVAAEVVWQQDGEKGPKGILYLTDQRLLFEQKERRATKKFLGIITTKSEMLQNVPIDVPIAAIESVKDKEEGGFLGIGTSDILEFVFAASAPLSRARFLLRYELASDWAVHLKRVRTGSVIRDRSAAHVEEAEAIQNLVFPPQCPNCFAAVPKPPVGATAVTCEYCNISIQPLDK